PSKCDHRDTRASGAHGCASPRDGCSLLSQESATGLCSLQNSPMSDAPRILLVVDANFEVANALADAAAEHGWEPFLAGGAAAALGIVHRLQGEVLLLVDLVSPVSGGLAL